MSEPRSPIQFNNPRDNQPNWIVLFLGSMLLLSLTFNIYHFYGGGDILVQDKPFNEQAERLAVHTEQEPAYPVREPAIALYAEKMNILYIGVENPLFVLAAGVSSDGLMVSISGGDGRIQKVGPSNYTVMVSRPGECRITVSGGGIESSRIFRVKRIPGPVARLSKYTGGAISNGEFKAQGGVSAFLDDFDFDAHCVIQGYQLTYLAPQQEPVTVVNAGPRFNAESRSLVNRAQPGDIYHFDNVKARCPGDVAERLINSMAFKIQ